MSEHPETKTINGQTAVRVDSPLKNWPGCIYVPQELTPGQFDQWWVAFNTQRPKDTPPERYVYMTRQHLVLEWHIDGVEPHHMSDDGLNLPTARLFGFVTAATMPLIEEAKSFPNLPGWWSDTTNGSAAA